MIITDINADGGQKIAAQDPDHLVFQAMDVTKAEDWKVVVEFAVQRFGRLDVLVNNAGTTYRNKVSENTLIDVGVGSLFECQAGWLAD